MKHLLSLVITLLLLTGIAGSAPIQSRDRDNPTPLTAGEITGDLNGEPIEYFYSFTAGPGQVDLTVDIKSSDGTTGMNFELLDQKGAKTLVEDYAQADSGGQSGRKVGSVKVARKQRVILHLIPFKYGKGTFRVRIDGAAEYK